MNWNTGHGLSIYEALKHTPTLAHFLLQDYTDSSKATPPNSATPYEIIGVSYIQITTVVICASLYEQYLEENNVVSQFKELGALKYGRQLL